MKAKPLEDTQACLWRNVPATRAGLRSSGTRRSRRGNVVVVVPEQPSGPSLESIKMDTRTRPIVLGPGEGRAYALGSMSGVFKADEDETAATYSISEWWLEPHSPGPGPHSHSG